MTPEHKSLCNRLAGSEWRGAVGMEMDRAQAAQAIRELSDRVTFLDEGWAQRLQDHDEQTMVLCFERDNAITERDRLRAVIAELVPSIEAIRRTRWATQAEWEAAIARLDKAMAAARAALEGKK